MIDQGVHIRECNRMCLNWWDLGQAIMGCPKGDFQSCIRGILQTGFRVKPLYLHVCILKSIITNWIIEHTELNRNVDAHNVKCMGYQQAL